MQLEMIKCPKCGNDFPKKRKELGYHVCVNCSTVEPVVGITTVEGSGDHTYNDLIIMEQSKARAIKEKEAQLSGKRVHLEVLDFDEEEENEKETSRAISDTIKKIRSNEEKEDLEDEEEEIRDKKGFQGIDY